MKIRNGFVSNSSSSSFLVAFLFLPKSIEDLKEMLFKNMKLESYDDRDYTDDAASYIFGEIKHKKPATLEEAEESVCNGWFEGRKDFDYQNHDWNSKEDEKRMLEFYDKENEKGRKIAREFVKNNKDSHVFIFEFSDNDGEFFGTLEHRGTFDNIPHIKTSYH